MVNANQTVIIIWDPATKTEHFIRKASFKSDGDDFGFLIPTPSQPELSESGDEAFRVLQEVTKPRLILGSRAPQEDSGGLSCGCSRKVKTGAPAPPPPVQVLAEKEVAGFHAVVLEATGAAPLIDWLKDHGYAFSPQIADWAKPYVDGGWKITALKVAKSKDQAAVRDLAAAALRLSFKTDQPLFPYREPDYKGTAELLRGWSRLLRIYFISDARYAGELTKDHPWTGNVVWSNQLSAEQRKATRGSLKLADAGGSESWWLTEFEDQWPYRVAPSDLYFAKSASQATVERPPVYASTDFPSDVTVYAIFAAVVIPALISWKRRADGGRPKSSPN